MAELRVNEQIRVPTVRLIGSDGQQLGVVPTQRALALAQSEGLDLVEIAPTVQPPVCRILDHGKFRYETQQKAKENKKKQRAVTWKEIRMAPKIDEHDIETKVKAAARFLDEGDKLKVTVRFRGRELAHPDRGRALLLSIGERLKEHGSIERPPLLEGRQMMMIMNPVRRDASAAPAAAAKPAPTAPAAAAP
ncbi:MAG: translation initiation factor IF-3, partial [Candidatus Limnocylindria bacterium]